MKKIDELKNDLKILKELKSQIKNAPLSDNMIRSFLSSEIGKQILEKEGL